MARTFTTDDATSVDLLNFANDHLRSARVLILTDDLRLYDSAGFLIHLGIELHLKAVLLDAVGKFQDEHSLIKLIDMIEKNGISVSAETRKAFEWLQAFWNMKYPNLRSPIEVGTEDIPKFNQAIKCAAQLIPDKLRQEYRQSPPTEKGGRMWMERPSN